MNKIYDYFNCSEENFRLLILFQSQETIEIFTKKWGKEFKKLDNPTKSNEIDTSKFNLYSFIFRIDIKYLDYLKKQNKTDAQIFQSLKETNIIDKFSIIYNITIDYLNDLINKFSENKRNSLIYYFGINRKKYSIIEISEIIKKDENEIYKILYNTLVDINSNLKLLNERKNTKMIQKPKIVATIKKETPMVITQVPVSNQKIIIKEETKKPTYNLNHKLIELKQRKITNTYKLAIYYMLKNRDIEDIVLITIDLFNIEVEELYKNILENIDLFEDKDKIIEQIINRKLYNILFDSNWFTNKENIKNASFERQLEIYKDLENYCKKKK